MTIEARNFRVIRHEYKGDTWETVHLVDYDQAGKPLSFMADPLPTIRPDDDRPLARTARGGLTGVDHGSGRSRGRAMHRDRPEGPKQPGSARGPGFGGSPEPRSAAQHTLRLTEERSRNTVSGRSRAHAGNVG
jgi:hypothetical protein